MTKTVYKSCEAETVLAETLPTAATDWDALSRERRARLAKLLRLDAPTTVLLSDMKLVLHADICRRRGRYASRLWIVALVARYVWHEALASAVAQWDTWKHRTGWCGGPDGCDFCQLEVECRLLNAETVDEYIERMTGGNHI